MTSKLPLGPAETPAPRDFSLEATPPAFAFWRVRLLVRTRRQRRGGCETRLRGCNSCVRHHRSGAQASVANGCLI